MTHDIVLAAPFSPLPNLNDIDSHHRIKYTIGIISEGVVNYSIQTEVPMCVHGIFTAKYPPTVLQ
jgi:hypothetical protein